MKWYEILFNDLGVRYLDYAFTKGTSQEVDFLEQFLNHDRTIRILDIACGAGRHSIELSKRGYYVVGFDLAMRQLEVAQDLATKINVKVNLVRADARAIPFSSRFDWAICLCEGAFGLMESDRENEAILDQVHMALKPKGKFLLNVLNAAFAIRHPEYDTRLDAQTCTGYWTESYTTEQGKQKQIECFNRYYTFPEMTLLLQKHGFKMLDGWGCQAGNFQKKTIELDDFEILVLAEKR
jgi:SAM-dependent methyltransferase